MALYSLNKELSCVLYFFVDETGNKKHYKIYISIKVLEIVAKIKNMFEICKDNILPKENCINATHTIH